MTMDLGQLSQMTTWLDEEHRRSKAEFISLQQQVQRLEAELEDQSQVLRSLEERVAGMQSQQITFTRLDAALKELKEDVSHMLAQSDERRQQESRETARVREITLQLAAQHNLSVSLLPMLADVDTPEDLLRLRRGELLAGLTPRLSVIVPTLNEAPRLEQTLTRASNRYRSRGV